MVGLEPTSLAAHGPKPCVFTNFTTSALDTGGRFATQPSREGLGEISPLALFSFLSYFNKNINPLI